MVCYWCIVTQWSYSSVLNNHIYQMGYRVNSVYLLISAYMVLFHRNIVFGFYSNFGDEPMPVANCVGLFCRNRFSVTFITIRCLRISCSSCFADLFSYRCGGFLLPAISHACATQHISAACLTKNGKLLHKKSDAGCVRNFNREQRAKEFNKWSVWETTVEFN